MPTDRGYEDDYQGFILHYKFPAELGEIAKNNTSDQIMEKYMKTKVVCACGTPCERCNMFNHKRTKKHIKLMAKKELEENQIQILHREIEELKEQLKNIYEYCVAKLP